MKFRGLKAQAEPVAKIVPYGPPLITKGQRAVAVAKLFPEPEKGGRGRKNPVLNRVFTDFAMAGTHPVSQREAAANAGMSEHQEKQAVRVANVPEAGSGNSLANARQAVYSGGGNSHCPCRIDQACCRLSAGFWYSSGRLAYSVRHHAARMAVSSASGPCEFSGL